MFNMLVNLKKLRKSRKKNRIGQGMYLANGLVRFDFGWYLERYGIPVFEKYQPIVNEPSRIIGTFGVCDYPEQVLEQIPELVTSKEKFVVGFTKIKRNEQSPFGWRWKKWGKYIGTQQPKHEYIYDDKHIDEVYFYQILRVK